MHVYLMQHVIDCSWPHISSDMSDMLHAQRASVRARALWMLLYGTTHIAWHSELTKSASRVDSFSGHALELRVVPGLWGGV